MPSNHHLHQYQCLGSSESGVHLYESASLIWCCVKTHLCCWQVTSRKDQQQYWYDKTAPYQYVSVNAFAEGFKQFHVGECLNQELNVPFVKEKSHPAALVRERYAISNWELFLACFAREILLMKRNRFIYIFRTIQVC
jgi:hypothetical protein